MEELCRVTITDIKGGGQVIEVKASSVYRAVAQAIKLKAESVATDGFQPIKVQSSGLRTEGGIRSEVEKLHGVA
jgi:hypothetical protein